jgi:steroid 5-alpha reductase family enzyme
MCMDIVYAIAASPFATSVIILFIYMTWVFFLSLYLKNNSIVDIAYGLGFILIVATILYNFGEYPLGGVVTALISVWGLRLAIRIHERNRTKPEDFRYAAWRKEWSWFKTRSFFQIYMLQGGIIFCIASPAIVAASHPAAFLSPLSILGVCVWLVGFFFETIGDYQLDRFIKNPKNKGMLLENGLWAYTRHPNYFGEATMWWGIWFAALPATLAVGWFAVALTCIGSPILITFFLLKVSGVPMLEKAMQKKPGWQTYATRVSAFIPWFPQQLKK